METAPAAEGIRDVLLRERSLVGDAASSSTLAAETSPSTPELWRHYNRIDTELCELDFGLRAQTDMFAATRSPREFTDRLDRVPALERLVDYARNVASRINNLTMIPGSLHYFPQPPEAALAETSAQVASYLFPNQFRTLPYRAAVAELRQIAERSFRQTIEDVCAPDSLPAFTEYTKKQLAGKVEDLSPKAIFESHPLFQDNASAYFAARLHGRLAGEVDRFLETNLRDDQAALIAPGGTVFRQHHPVLNLVYGDDVRSYAGACLCRERTDAVVRGIRCELGAAALFTPFAILDALGFFPRVEFPVEIHGVIYHGSSALMQNHFRSELAKSLKDLAAVSKRLERLEAIEPENERGLARKVVGANLRYFQKEIARRVAQAEPDRYLGVCKDSVDAVTDALGGLTGSA